VIEGETRTAEPEKPRTVLIRKVGPGNYCLGKIVYESNKVYEVPMHVRDFLICQPIEYYHDKEHTNPVVHFVDFDPQALKAAIEQKRFVPMSDEGRKLLEARPEAPGGFTVATPVDVGEEGTFDTAFQPVARRTARDPSEAAALLGHRRRVVTIP
jgi:hypothetical protein